MLFGVLVDKAITCNKVSLLYTVKLNSLDLVDLEPHPELKTTPLENSLIAKKSSVPENCAAPKVLMEWHKRQDCQCAHQ